MTALMSHCFYCYAGGVKRELKQGADPNAQDNNGYTAMMWLCRMYDRKHYRERKRMFRALVKYGASVTMKDSAGQDVLFQARIGPAKRFRKFVEYEVRRLTRSSTPTLRAGQHRRWTAKKR